MRVLVTGSSGFVGHWLVKALQEDGHQVNGFSTRDGYDVRNYEQVRGAIAAIEPDEIYHLAAASWPRESLSDTRRSLDVNIKGAAHVLDACRQLGSTAKILLAGTSEEYGYGWRPGEVLDEETKCWPTTPYGVSKLAATTLGMSYVERFGLHVVATRAFNHTGAGRQAWNAESAWARQIVAAERGETDVIRHGDLSSTRNFTNVRDVVRAYRLVIGQPSGIWNVCSDDNVTMQTVMNILMSVSGVGVPLRQEPGLGSKAEGPWTRPSCAKLADATGWKPSVSLNETLGELLEYWRGR